MTLRNARILSSCNDASNKQTQNMRVDIKVEDKTIPQPPVIQQSPGLPVYPQVPQQSAGLPVYPPPEQPVYAPPEQPVNFTMQAQPPREMSTSQSTVPNQVLTRSLDIEKDIQIQDLETKNKFLNILLTVYQQNPLYINSYVVCPSQLLMQMIKLLTNCDRVDLILNDDIACGGCAGSDKLIYVSKILIVKGDETKDMKYGYNDVYSKLIAYGISLKIVC